MAIDFEFCGYNYRGFDLANHFSEWMYDYSHKEYPFYRREKAWFPSKERQVRETRKERNAGCIHPHSHSWAPFAYTLLRYVV